jgi:hypothetical protein
MMMAYSVPEFAELLRVDCLCPERPTPLVGIGIPGIGKTAAPKAVADSLGWGFFHSPAGELEQPDLIGYLYLPPNQKDEERKAIRVPAGELAEVLLSGKPLIWDVDEIGQGAIDVQKGALRWFHRNETRLPKTARLMGATNRREDKAGVKEVLSPLMGRITQVMLRPPTVEEFTPTMLDLGFAPTVVAYLNWVSVVDAKEGTISSAHLCSGKVPGLGDPQPTPRGWDSVSMREQSATHQALPDRLKVAYYSGDVGETLACDFVAFTKTYQDAVFVEQVLVNPAGARIPEKGYQVHGLVSALAARAAQGKAPSDPVCAYLGRLADNGLASHVGVFITVIDQANPSYISMSNAGRALYAHPKIAASLSRQPADD